jgi:putative Holliday junction resolvase
MRVLALDYGRKRLGVAVTDPGGKIAQPYKVLEVKGRKDAVEKVVRIAEKLSPGVIVVGLPVHLSGKEGEMVEDVRRFIEELRRFLPHLSIETQDERLTSVWASRIHSQMKGAQKSWVHALSAQAILYDYLSRCGS